MSGWDWGDSYIMGRYEIMIRRDGNILSIGRSYYLRLPKKIAKQLEVKFKVSPTELVPEVNLVESNTHELILMVKFRRDKV